ncbi:hypothetical protein [uncultured Cetobacterium sp.]|uniref:hypothetical protein n=1 Tax=uncultured Cetobacterium sp. TaxID=527638 RepID=UPI00260F116B|nr:hypothetical protein [uncultured Cetobacterium sp.]
MNKEKMDLNIVKIKITKKDYKKLYKAYLKEVQGQDSIEMRKIFDLMNKRRYKL